MRISEALPPPESVAEKIIHARKQRALLRRLYRLVLDAKKSDELMMQIVVKDEAIDKRGAK